MNTRITADMLRDFEKRFDSDRANVIAMNSVMENGIGKSAIRSSSVRTLTHDFSISLDQGNITNQKQSGRCWMFAGFNCLRFKMIKDLHLEDFEFSQSYAFFYDKLEKANYFLESILHTLDMETSSRLIAHLLMSPVQDGGQWDMFSSIIDKYGAVPKSAMPESSSSSASRDMDARLTTKLRGYAAELREAHKSGASVEELAGRKEKMLGTIYDMLVICMGKPPKTFDFEYRDKDNNFYRAANLTPREFYDRFVGLNLSDYISLINAPTADKPYYRSYSVSYLGNVTEGRPVRYVNLPIDELKKAAIAQLKSGEPVWFGCDVGQSSSRDGGIMDIGLYDYENLFNTDFPMTKAQRLDYGESVMTHAMVFQGVNIDDNGLPDRWRVENSWGDEPGKKGYFVMSDEWFNEYNYQVVVNKRFLSDEIIRAYEQDPIMLDPWDPMGSLAK